MKLLIIIIMAYPCVESLGTVTIYLLQAQATIVALPKVDKGNYIHLKLFEKYNIWL